MAHTAILSTFNCWYFKVHCADNIYFTSNLESKTFTTIRYCYFYPSKGSANNHWYSYCKENRRLANGKSKTILLYPSKSCVYCKLLIITTCCLLLSENLPSNNNFILNDKGNRTANLTLGKCLKLDVLPLRCGTEDTVWHVDLHVSITPLYPVITSNTPQSFEATHLRTC